MGDGFYTCKNPKCDQRSLDGERYCPDCLELAREYEDDASDEVTLDDDEE